MSDRRAAPGRDEIADGMGQRDIVDSPQTETLTRDDLIDLD